MQEHLAAQSLFLLIVFLAGNPEINFRRKLPQLTVQVLPSGKPGINTTFNSSLMAKTNENQEC